MWLLSKSARGAYHSSEAESKNSPPIPRIRINDARSRGTRVIVMYYETAHPGLLVDRRNHRPAGTDADVGRGRDETLGGGGI